MNKHTWQSFRLGLFSLLFFFSSTVLHAQNTADWQTYFEQLSDLEDIETDNWENAYEVVSELAAHPIDINSASRDDLERIPFLTNK